MAIYSWLSGIAVALLGGGVAAWAFSTAAEKLLRIPPKPYSSVPRIPPWLTGLVERSFFVVLVAINDNGALESMMGWLAIKLAVNWQKYDYEAQPSAQSRGLLALLTGAISLAFAFVGGAIISGKICAGS